VPWAPWWYFTSPVPPCGIVVTASSEEAPSNSAKIAVQLSATAFEIAFLAAASRDEQEPGTVQPV